MFSAPVVRISSAVIAVTGDGVTKPVRAMREPVTVTLSSSVVALPASCAMTGAAPTAIRPAIKAQVSGWREGAKR